MGGYKTRGRGSDPRTTTLSGSQTRAPGFAGGYLPFQHKEQVLIGEQMPDPRTDSSFQKYVRDEDFTKLMAKLGYK
jgi:hypothetical protein